MVVRQGRFLYAEWDRLVRAAAAAVPEIADATCPFGFEVFRDDTFRAIVPRRFYVLAAPAAGWHGDADLLARRYLEALRDLVGPCDRSFAESFVLLRWNGRQSLRLRGDSYSCQPTDRLLSVQIRPGAASAVDDYARYMVCVLGGVKRGALGELARFERDTRARRRFFQLFAMLDHLVARVVPTVGPPLSLYLLDQPREFQEFYDGVTSSAPSAEERAMLEDVVLVRFAQLFAAVQPRAGGPDQQALFRTKDFYSDAELEVEIDARIGADLVREVISSLRDFVDRDEPSS
jgi:hypothetical protein